MPLKLFELVGTDETRPFSPCLAASSGWRWRIRGSAPESIPWCFTDKAGDRSAPIRPRCGAARWRHRAVVDSWVIANYLER